MKWPQPHITSDVQPQKKAPLLTDDKGGVGPIGWMLQREKSLALPRIEPQFIGSPACTLHSMADQAIAPLPY